MIIPLEETGIFTGNSFLESGISGFLTSIAFGGLVLLRAFKIAFSGGKNHGITTQRQLVFKAYLFAWLEEESCANRGIVVNRHEIS